MKKVELSDKEFVREQYTNPDKIDCRIAFHNNNSENKYGLHKWLYDQMQINDGNIFLELGCGLGTLWNENSKKIPSSIELKLSDLSIGMINSCRKSLNGIGNFKYLVTDAQNIPIMDNTIDAIIANHMLYHIQDKNVALSEIKRILKPNGKLYSSTNGKNNMKELTEIVIKVNPDLVWWNTTNTFTLDEGSSLLGNWFSTVELRKYKDSLLISDPDELITYILSGRGKILEKDISQFRKIIVNEIDQHGGELRITKDTGTFIAY
jgi:SAM-dependent methyltransferase